jgi:hypothetical protein
MTADNFNQTLTAFQQRSPFRPFTVVLARGTRFEIDHPGALVFRDGVAVFVGPGGIPVIFDHEGSNTSSATWPGNPRPDRRLERNRKLSVQRPASTQPANFAPYSVMDWSRSSACGVSASFSGSTR